MESAYNSCLLVMISLKPEELHIFLLFVACPTWEILILGLSCSKENTFYPSKGSTESVWMMASVYFPRAKDSAA